MAKHDDNELLVRALAALTDAMYETLPVKIVKFEETYKGAVNLGLGTGATFCAEEARADPRLGGRQNNPPKVFPKGMKALYHPNWGVLSFELDGQRKYCSVHCDDLVWFEAGA